MYEDNKNETRKLPASEISGFPKPRLKRVTYVCISTVRYEIILAKLTAVRQNNINVLFGRSSFYTYDIIGDVAK